MNDYKVTQPGLAISDAAQTLRISREAVRQRIRRGTLPAAKVDNRWLVQAAAPDQYGASDIGASYATSTPIESLDGDNQLILQLRGEVAFLRRALEERAGEVQRRDALIATMMERLLAQPSPSGQSRAV